MSMGWRTIASFFVLACTARQSRPSSHAQSRRCFGEAGCRRGANAGARRREGARAFLARRPTAAEQLVDCDSSYLARAEFCGDAGKPASSMRIYGHDMKRRDTEQVLRVGIDWVEKSL